MLRGLNKVQALLLAATVAFGFLFAGIPASAQSAEDLLASSADDRKVKEWQRNVQRNIKQQRWPQAIRDMKSLVQAFPYNSDFQLTLGLLFRKSNDLEEARRKFNEYLELGGAQAVGQLLIAECYAADKNRDKVMEHLHLAAENGMNLMKVAESFESLKPYRSETDFIKLALQLEKFELQENELKDPMTNVFQRVEDEPDQLVNNPNGPPTAKQEETLRFAQIALAKIERALSQENEAAAMDSYTRLLELTKEIDRFTVPRFVQEMRKIIERKEEIESRIKEIRLKYQYKKAVDHIAAMERVFKEGDYPKVEMMYKDLEIIAREMTKVDSSFEEVADKILQVGRVPVQRSKVRRDFNARPLSIQGIVLSKEDSYAIVNNRLLRVGDRYDGMVVAVIEPNQVYFDYRNERIPLVFRRY